MKINTDNMTTNPQKVFNLFCQSELYGVKELKERAEQVLLDYVDEDNVILLFENADKLNAENLKKRCKAYIMRNYEELASTEEYKSLPPFLIQEINHTRETIGF